VTDIGRRLIAMGTEYEVIDLPLNRIKVDPSVQSRTKTHPGYVQEFGEAMVGGAVFPPVVVFFDGKTYWLADGFHRHAGAALVGIAKLRAEVRRGSHRDAVVYSAGANIKFSIPRTPEDVRRAIYLLFEDPECWGWTDRRIGDHCGVAGHTVKLHRMRYAQDRDLPLPEIVTRSDGQPRQYNREKKETPNLVERKRKGKTSGYACYNKGKKIYLGSSKEKATIAAERIAGEKESRRRNLELKCLKHFLSARGFAFDSCDCTSTSHPGLRGLHGHGTVIISTDFRGAESVVSAIGCLRMLRLLVGTPDARLVVVCYPEDGPRSLMDLAELDGVEFLTPERLTASIKATGT
jgi:hypothetical protein